MAKTIDADLLQKERDELEKKLIQARQNVETSKNQVMSVIGAIQMTDRLIEISKEGNYSKSRANSEGVPEGNAAEVQKSLGADTSKAAAERAVEAVLEGVKKGVKENHQQNPLNKPAKLWNIPRQLVTRVRSL